MTKNRPPKGPIGSGKKGFCAEGNHFVAVAYLNVCLAGSCTTTVCDACASTHAARHVIDALPEAEEMTNDTDPNIDAS